MSGGTGTVDRTTRLSPSCTDKSPAPVPVSLMHRVGGGPSVSDGRPGRTTTS